MKTRKINLANNPEKDDICHSLNGTFWDKSDMKDLKEVYEENRLTEKHEAFKEQNTKNVVTSSDADNAWCWFLNMSMGIKEAAYYLAVSFLEGYGVKENETLMNICLAIGTKLKDQKTVECAEGTDIPTNILKLADKCITLMKYGEKAVKGRDITYEEAIGWGKCLDKIVIQETRQSFEANIYDTAYKMAGARFVEVVEAPQLTGEHHHCEIS